MLKFNFIDVGSKGKLHKRWKSNINNIITFDPVNLDLTETITEFSGKRFHYPKAVFDIEGKRDFHICRKYRVSSLYKPNLMVINQTCYRKTSYNFLIEKVIEVDCVRLDTILQSIPIIFNFLKVDAQGADLNVIKSLGKYLQILNGIEVECNRVPIYEGIPLEYEIREFLEKNNFELIKKIPATKEKGKVWNDCLFINKNLIAKKKEEIKRIYE